MPRSEALKIARLEAQTQLTSQIIGLAADPLWSTILGFVAVHELYKHDMLPKGWAGLGDEVLYAGIIAINTARQPAMMEFAGKGISAAAAAAGAAGGVGATYAATKVGQKLVARGKGPVSFSKAMALAGKSGGTLTVLPPGAMPSDTSADKYSAAVREGKWWQIWRAF